MAAESFAFTPGNEERFVRILARYPNARAALIPTLHLAQEQHGWLPPHVMEYVARRLDLPPTKVLQVASFYTMFDKKPVGRYKIEVCTSIPCCMMGGYAVSRQLCQRLGVQPGETTSDGRFTVLEAECLAGCGHAPLMQINGEYHENLTPERVESILSLAPLTPAAGSAETDSLRMERVLTANWYRDRAYTLPVYKEAGGYRSLQKAFELTGAQIVDEVKKSNLRGRGGAGFPTGMKWSFLPAQSDVPKYLVINADEGEPGTFKDRYIMERDPHRLLEGCLIAGWALGLKAAYIYIRGEMVLGAQRLEEAVAELHAAGLLGRNIASRGFDYEIHVHRGAGAYICGEETALIESLEGKAGQPRLKPPFPAIVGLFGCPTVVNNVETIACVPTILERGAEWFAAQGSKGNGGPKIVQISGKISRPGTYEAPTGISLREFIHSEAYGGGPLAGRTLKAIVPGGVSAPPLRADEIDVGMDFDQLRDKGTMGGTSGVIIMDDSVCLVRMAARIAHFYHHESCGQCTPCREGSGWVAKMLDALEAGRGSREDVDQLLEIINSIDGNTICPLGDAIAMPIRGYLTKFREEFIAHAEQGCCPYPAW